MMRKIKKDDEVIVLTGKYKGKRGKVIKAIDSGKKFLVEGVNIVKKHMKPNPQRGQQGGIIEKEAPIHASNVAIYNPVTEKADRVGFTEVGGKKKRCFKSNGELIDQ